MTPPELDAILVGFEPAIPGLAAADGSLPPPHVAERSLRLLRDGCLPEWALPLHIVDLSRRVIVGGCGCKGSPICGTAEIGYGVAPSFRGRGIATWAIRDLLRLAEASGIVREVFAHIVPGNMASEAAVSRNAFRRGLAITDPDGEEVFRWSRRVVT